LVALTLLVAFGGAITIASIAGARRADSAFDGFLDQTSAPLSVTLAGETDNLSLYDGAPALAHDMAAVPGVEGVMPVSWMGVATEANGVTTWAFAIATLGGVGDRPPAGGVPVHGRMTDPSRPDEVAINETAADYFGVEVGDEVTLNSYAADQVDAMVTGAPAPFRGPEVTARVAGVIRTAEDVSDNSEPIVYLTHAFHTTYGDGIAKCDCSFWIRTAPEDVATVSAALPSVFGDYPLVVEPVDSVLSARVEDAVGLEVGALRIAGAIGSLASALVVAQALVRHISGSRAGSATLVALGARRRDIVGAWVLNLLPVALAGSVTAALAATAMSPLFPRGLARQAVVHPGLRFDALAVVGGAAVVMLATVALSLAAAHATVGRAFGRAGSVTGRSRALVLRTRPTVALGANLAVDPARDRARLPALTAVVGLALAVGGALAVALVDVSAGDVLRTPRAFAAAWDLELSDAPDDREALIASTAAEPIEAFAVATRVSGNVFLATGPRATALVSPGSLDVIVGSMGPVLERGLPAATADDVVLGSAIADDLGVDIGDRLSVNSGANGDQAFVVSGIGRLADGDETDRVFFVTPEGLGRLQSIDEQSVDGAYVRLGAVDDRVRERLADLGWVATVPPSKVANLSEVGSVPRLLAVALAVLGLGGVTHSLLVSGRRRRYDLAVATSLGFTRRQVAATVRWQGLLTAGVAIVVGLPLGALLGRLVWKHVADGVGAVDLVSVPWAMLLLVPAAALLAVGCVASVVGHRTAALDPARTLRGE
jgi:ABC-type lipoprotein release transport system permease subunit